MLNDVLQYIVLGFLLCRVTKLATAISDLASAWLAWVPTLTKIEGELTKIENKLKPKSGLTWYGNAPCEKGTGPCSIPRRNACPKYLDGACQIGNDA